MSTMAGNNDFMDELLRTGKVFCAVFGGHEPTTASEHKEREQNTKLWASKFLEGHAIPSQLRCGVTRVRDSHNQVRTAAVWGTEFLDMVIAQMSETFVAERARRLAERSIDASTVEDIREEYEELEGDMEELEQDYAKLRGESDRLKEEMAGVRTLQAALTEMRRQRDKYRDKLGEQAPPTLEQAGTVLLDFFEEKSRTQGLSVVDIRTGPYRISVGTDHAMRSGMDHATENARQLGYDEGRAAAFDEVREYLNVELPLAAVCLIDTLEN